jgi:hypothetical protein
VGRTRILTNDDYIRISIEHATAETARVKMSDAMPWGIKDELWTKTST